jgi:hypothetical protein
LVYPAISPNDNHWPRTAQTAEAAKPPERPHFSRGDLDTRIDKRMQQSGSGQEIFEKRAPGALVRLGNEGVGEHVRTRFHLGLWAKLPGEIADHLRSAPNEENLFLLPDRFLEGAAPSKDDPAV